MAVLGILSSLMLVLLALVNVLTASELDDFIRERTDLAGVDLDETGSGLPSDFPETLLSLLQGAGPSAEAGPEGEGMQKRVFCNGFTGCGGRHRGRRRYPQQPAETKRLFCNPYLGCSGGKRSQDSPVPVHFESRLKRLFCNAYGGCRGGKRSASDMERN